MDFLIADRGEGGDDHVEAIEPGPSFDEVESGGAESDNEQESSDEKFDVAEGCHGLALSS
jgi:hypothetical protein